MRTGTLRTFTALSTLVRALEGLDVAEARELDELLPAWIEAYTAEGEQTPQCAIIAQAVQRAVLDMLRAAGCGS